MATESDGTSLAELVSIVERAAVRAYHFEVGPDLLNTIAQGLGVIVITAAGAFILFKVLFNAVRTVAGILNVFGEIVDLLRVAALNGWRRLSRHHSVSVRERASKRP